MNKRHILISMTRESRVIMGGQQRETDAPPGQPPKREYSFSHLWKLAVEEKVSAGFALPKDLRF